MGFLPSWNYEIANLTVEELGELKTLLDAELAMSRARQSHIDKLLKRIQLEINKKGG